MNFGMPGNPVPSRVISMPPQQQQQHPQFMTRNVVPRPPISQAVHGTVSNNIQHHTPKSMGSAISGGPPRALGTRSIELLDQLRMEVEMLTAEVSNHRAEKEEYEQKYRQQLTEMEHIQMTVNTLREAHIQLKARYDEDILRKNESRSSNIPSSGPRATSSIPSPLLNSTGGSNRAGLASRGGLLPLEHIKGGDTRGWKMADIQPGGGSVPSSNKRPRPRSPSSFDYPLASLNRKNSSDSIMGAVEVAAPREPSFRDSNRYRIHPFHVSGNDLPMGHSSRSPQDRFLPPTIPNNPLRLAPPPPDSYLSSERSIRGSDQDKNSINLPGPILPMPVYRTSSNQKRTLNGEGGGQNHPSPSYQKSNNMGGNDSRHGSSRVDNDNRPSMNRGDKEPRQEGNMGGNDSRKGSLIRHSPLPPPPFVYPKWTLEYTKGVDTRRPAVELESCISLGSVVCCVRFSADGTKVATGSHSCVKVFEVSSGRELFEHKKVVPPEDKDADPYVRAVCMSPNGEQVVAVMENNAARLLSLLENGPPPLNLIGHQSEVYSLDWTGDIIASGSGDCQVRLWDAKSGSCRLVLGATRGPTDGVTCVALRPDGTLVAAASIDTTIHLWTTSEGALIYKLDSHSESVYSVAFSADGSQLISGGLDKTTKVWGISKGLPPSSVPTPTVLIGHKDYVLSVCCTHDGRYIVSGSKDSTVIMWDIVLKRQAVVLRGFQNSIIGVGACPNQRLFATGGGDKVICLWRYTEAEDREQPHGSVTSNRRNNSNNGMSVRMLHEDVNSTENDIDSDQQHLEVDDDKGTDSNKDPSSTSSLKINDGRDESIYMEENMSENNEESENSEEFGLSDDRGEESECSN